MGIAYQEEGYKQYLSVYSLEQTLHYRSLDLKIGAVL
jgi:hypothetical protein